MAKTMRSMPRPRERRPADGEPEGRLSMEALAAAAGRRGKPAGSELPLFRFGLLGPVGTSC